MTPRTDVIGIDIDAGPADVRKLVDEHGYSRYPIYRGDLDHIIGVINTKDVLARLLPPEAVDVEPILRQPLFVPDSLPLAKLLRQFQQGRTHIAVVLDDFGGTAGIITLEDILEELVGEIQDEYDSEEARLVKHSETVAFADSSVWPGEANELLNSSLPEDDADTLAGLFMDAVGRLPDKNESVRIHDVKLTVLAKDENRILRLKLERIEGETEELR